MESTLETMKHYILFSGLSLHVEQAAGFGSIMDVYFLYETDEINKEYKFV